MPQIKSILSINVDFSTIFSIIDLKFIVSTVLRLILRAEVVLLTDSINNNTLQIYTELLQFFFTSSDFKVIVSFILIGEYLNIYGLKIFLF